MAELFLRLRCHRLWFTTGKVNDGRPFSLSLICWCQCCLVPFQVTPCNHSESDERSHAVRFGDRVSMSKGERRVPGERAFRAPQLKHDTHTAETAVHRSRIFQVRSALARLRSLLRRKGYRTNNNSPFNVMCISTRWALGEPCFRDSQLKKKLSNDYIGCCD